MAPQINPFHLPSPNSRLLLITRIESWPPTTWALSLATLAHCAPAVVLQLSVPSLPQTSLKLVSLSQQPSTPTSSAHLPKCNYQLIGLLSMTSASTTSPAHLRDQRAKQLSPLTTSRHALSTLHVLLPLTVLALQQVRARALSRALQSESQSTMVTPAPTLPV